MNQVEINVALNEKRIAMLEKWQDSCAWMPQILHELVQWRQDQNGDIRDIKESIKELQNDVRDLTISDGQRRRRTMSKDRVLKWALAGVAFGSLLTAILTNVL